MYQEINSHKNANKNGRAKQNEQLEIDGENVHAKQADDQSTDAKAKKCEQQLAKPLQQRKANLLFCFFIVCSLFEVWVGDGAFDVPKKPKYTSRAVVGASPYGFTVVSRETHDTLDVG